MADDMKRCKNPNKKDRLLGFLAKLRAIFGIFDSLTVTIASQERR